MSLMNNGVGWIGLDETGLSMFGLFLQTLYFVLWTGMRMVWWVFQRMLWFFSGVSHDLWASQSAPGYKFGAQVQDIVYRFKYDEFMGASGRANFVTVHREFVSMDYLRKDNVFLYDVNKNEAVFVEAEPGQQLWRMKYGSFFSVNLFRYSKRMITLPIEHFHRFAEELGDPKARLIFLPNGGRCGSTLLCQAFQATDAAVVYSEPYALDALSFMTGSLPQEVIDVLARDIIRVLCKPVASPKRVDTFVFKPKSPQMECVTLYGRVFPNAKQIFMWRDRRMTAESLEKLLKQLTLVQLGRVACAFSGTITGKLSQMKMGPHSRFSVQDVVDLCQYPIVAGLLPVAITLSAYREFCNEGMKVVAVRYEDLVADKENTLKAVFEYCNLDMSLLPKALNGFLKDSQAQSGFARTTLRKVKNSPWSDEARKRADEMMERHGLPPMDVPVPCEGVISCPQEGTVYST